MRFNDDAPITLRKPSSFVLRSAVNEARQIIRGKKMRIATTVKLNESFPIIKSVRYSLSKTSLRKYIETDNRDHTFSRSFHTGKRILAICLLINADEIKPAEISRVKKISGSVFSRRGPLLKIIG